MINDFKACLSDWDGTLRDGYTVKDWIPFLVKKFSLDKNLIHNVDRCFENYRNGTICYDELVKNAADVHASALVGLRQSDVEYAAWEFVKNDDKLYNFVDLLSNKCKDNNVKLIIISGAPYEIILAYSRIIHIDNIYSLKVSTDNKGLFQKNITQNYGIYRDKATIAKKIQKNHKIVMAIGNSLSDAPLYTNNSVNIFIYSGELDKNTKQRLEKISIGSIRYKQVDNVEDSILFDYE